MLLLSIGQRREIWLWGVGNGFRHNESIIDVHWEHKTLDLLESMVLDKASEYS